jgi:DNA-binding NarL/FixJ family response regulator
LEINMMRQGLIRLITGQPDVQVVGEADSGQEAIELARQIKPDVIIMDVSMPEMDGIEATRRIKNELPETRVIGLSMFEDEHVTKAMRQAGAEVLVSKSSSMSELLKAIYGISRNQHRL